MSPPRHTWQPQDKVYTQAHSVPIIYEVGLHLFLRTIIRSPSHPIHTHLIGSLLSQVQLERDGETITRTTVRDCVDILLRLQDPAFPASSAHAAAKTSVYCTDFEPEFLRRSGEFYELEAGDMLERGDAPAYLRNVGRCNRLPRRCW
jgi:cullin 3